jgi:hypothetical protein
VIQRHLAVLPSEFNILGRIICGRRIRSRNIMEHLGPRDIGLRAQDVYSGLQTVDQTSGLIAAELEATRLTGMAATVAANIRGIDVIGDVRALTVVAAQQWGIDGLALRAVLDVLEEVDYITRHKDIHGRVAQIDERVPLLHGDMYETLGEQWLSNDPTEVDEASVDALDCLALAPMRLSQLRARYGDEDTVTSLLTIGEAAQFAKRFSLTDGDELVWSPFCAYERPEALTALFGRFDDETIRRQFEEVRRHQGLPLDGNAAVLNDAVGHGILVANSIDGSGGKARFAFLPYKAEPELRHIKKIILEKALILLACVRYGQHYAVHPIKWPGSILRALLDRRVLTATTEARSQYMSAAQAQIVRLEPAGDGWYRPVLVDTPDNVAATVLALDLVEHGEPVRAREDPEQRLLFTGGRYLTPLMTMKDSKPKAALPGEVFLGIVESIKGER